MVNLNKTHFFDFGSSFLYSMCCAFPQSGDSSGATLEVPSEALLHPWFFFGSSLVFDTDDKRKVQGKGFLIKVLFTNTSYIRRSCLPCTALPCSRTAA